MIGNPARVLRARSVSVRIALTSLMLGTASMGCGHETGPSLSIAVANESLASSSTEANAASLCCCRVRGTVRNTSSIAVDVFIDYEATSAAGPLGPALDWVPNLGPGDEAAFDAPGILAPCKQVTGFTGRHRITGVFAGSSGGQ
jgi:hypothetical protein